MRCSIERIEIEAACDTGCPVKPNRGRTIYWTAFVTTALTHNFPPFHLTAVMVAPVRCLLGSNISRRVCKFRFFVFEA